MRTLTAISILAALLAGCEEPVNDCQDCADGGVVVDGGGPDGGGSCLPHAATKHRSAAAACDHERSPGTTPDVGPPADCERDTDCTAGENGRCTGNGHDGWRCTYDLCFDDDDCGAGKACACGGGFRSDANVCLASQCRTDADCATGFCSPTYGSCGNYSGNVGWYCHTCDDECVNDEDCAATGGAFDPYCAFDPSAGRWTCMDTHCAG